MTEIETTKLAGNMLVFFDLPAGDRWIYTTKIGKIKKFVLSEELRRKYISTRFKVMRLLRKNGMKFETGYIVAPYKNGFLKKIKEIMNELLEETNKYMANFEDAEKQKEILDRLDAPYLRILQN